MIGIHLKLSVTYVVGLHTTKMDMHFKVMDKTQTTEGLVKGATARPQIQRLSLLHQKEMEKEKIPKRKRTGTIY